MRGPDERQRRHPDDGPSTEAQWTNDELPQPQRYILGCTSLWVSVPVAVCIYREHVDRAHAVVAVLASLACLVSTTLWPWVRDDSLHLRLDKAVAALDRERALTASLQQNLVAERQIIATHEPYRRSDDAKFKAFVCAGLK